MVIYMKVKVGVSQRHIHLTADDYNALFDQPLTIKHNLNQPGQFAANETVILESHEKQIENVRVIGPERDYTQVEISRTDAYKLKLNPPVRGSGDLTNAEEITIIGPKGKIQRKAVIIADRHIHITKEEREKYGLAKDTYTVRVNGEKGGILENIQIKEAPNSYFELHLDTDDANSMNIKQNDEVELI